jgi:hypothetical protein
MLLNGLRTGLEYINAKTMQMILDLFIFYEIQQVRNSAPQSTLFIRLYTMYRLYHVTVIV